MKKQVSGLILLVAGLSFAAQAVVRDYTGVIAGTGMLNSNGNYSGGIAPANNLTADIIQFNQASYTYSVQTNAGRSVNGLIFGNDSTATADTTIYISGAAGQQLRLGASGIMMFTNAGNATINKIQACANQTWTNNSANTLSVGTLISSNASLYTVTLAGIGAKAITGIASDGSGTLGIKVAGGTTTLSGNNTFTGGLTLDSGTLKLDNNGALGGAANVFTINGGTLDVTGARSTANNNAINLNGDFNFAGTSTLNTGTGAVTLGGNRIVTVDASTLTVGGVIDDGVNTYSLTKAGAGTLTLTNANTYGGGTVLSNGTLGVNNINALGTGTFTINGGTVAGNGSAVTNNLIINGDFIASGNSGTTVAQFLSNTVSLGTAAGTSRTITASAAAPGTGQLTLGGVISDGTTANKIIKKGAGGLALSGANTFTGGVDLDEGLLFVNNTTALGTGMLSISNGTTLSVPGSNARTISNQVSLKGDFTLGATGKGALTLAGNMDLNGGSRKITIGNADGDIISGNITNGNGLTVSGNTLTLSGTNTYSGDTTIMNATVLSVSKDANLGAGNNINLNQNAKLMTTASFDTSKTITLSANGANQDIVTASGNTLTLNGKITGGTNGASMRLTGGGTVVYAAANDHEAATTIVNSTLRLTGAGTINNGNSRVTQNGATIDLGGTSQTIGDLNFIGGNSYLTNGDLTVTSITNGSFSGSVVTVGANLHGTGATLTQNQGTLILNGINDFTGATTVTSTGTLSKLVINGSTLSDITVQSGGTLGGTGTVQAVTLNAGAILAVGSSPGTMTFDGAVLLSEGSTNIMEIVSASIYDVLKGNGANTLTMDGETVFDFTGGVTNGFTIALSDMFNNWGSVVTTGATYSAIGLVEGQSLDFTGGNLTVIPEPAAIGMLGLGAIITLLLRRMRTY